MALDLASMASASSTREVVVLVAGDDDARIIAWNAGAAAEPEPEPEGKSTPSPERRWDDGWRRTGRAAGRGKKRQRVIAGEEKKTLTLALEEEGRGGKAAHRREDGGRR